MKSRLNARNCGGILAGCLLVAFLLTGCDSVEENRETQISKERLEESFTDAAFELGMRGALLASRFETLEDLKQVVSLQYFPKTGEEGDSLVIISMVNNGVVVTSTLAAGISEADLAAAASGSMTTKVSVGLSSGFGVRNRNLLSQVVWLSRRRQIVFGEGDPAFYDLAASMVEHIVDLDAACLVERDSSEKGYLNTFNHIIAQAFFTTLYSEEFADFVADVHERRTMPELISGQFTEEQLSDPITNPVDNYVDILNNEFGQELGKRLKSKFGIEPTTEWTPQLLASYLNELVLHFRRALFIEISPYSEEDIMVRRFASKLNVISQMFPN